MFVMFEEMEGPPKRTMYINLVNALTRVLPT